MNIQLIFTKYQLFASPNIFLQINSYHLGPQNVPPTSCSHQHLGLPTEMFWDQPPQKHCAAVYLKHLGGSTFKSYLRYLRYNVRTSEFSKFWSWFSQPPKVSKIDSNATVPHLAQHAVPPWQRKDLSFQLMASGAAEAPKLLELKKSGTKNFPHLSRVWNRFFDWNLHLKKNAEKMFTAWNRWGCLVQDLKRIPISMPWFSSFMVPFWTGNPLQPKEWQMAHIPTHNFIVRIYK